MISYTLHPNGAMIEYKPLDGKRFTLAELKKAVGGTNTLQILEVREGEEMKCMVCDDSGRLHKLAENHNASMMFGSVIVGTVLVCPMSMIHE